MQARTHLVIASVLAVGGAFFLSDAFGSGRGLSCWISSCGQQSAINSEFLVLSSVFFFVAAMETGMTLKRRRTGASHWETERQIKLRKCGIISLFLGSILTTYGLLEVSEIAFSIGALIAAIGAGLVLVAALTDIKPEKWQTRIVLPART